MTEFKWVMKRCLADFEAWVMLKIPKEEKPIYRVLPSAAIPVHFCIAFG